MPPTQPTKDSITPAIKPATRPNGSPLPVAVKVPPKSTATPAQGGDSLTPPADTNWERYAANGEPILSGLSSILLHGLAIVVIVTGLLSMFGGSAPPPVKELEPVEIGNGEEGGGGGSTEGVVDNAAGNLSRPKDQELTLDKPMIEQKLPEDDPTIKQSTPQLQEDPLANLQMEKLKDKPNLQNLGPVLKDALEGLAGRGRGGSGAGGGEGTGLGRGRGSGTGDGTGKTNRRGRRVLRWEMVFNTGNARNYLQQLAALDAVIAVPDKTGRLMTIRDIRARPAKPQYEDVKALNRIYWVDTSPETTEGVAAELQLDFTPAALVAFFPHSLEQELLAKELAYAGRKEEEIEHTRFAISFSGGKPVARVISQRPIKK